MKTFRLVLAAAALLTLAGCESAWDPNRICQDHPDDGSMCDDGSGTGGTYQPPPTFNEGVQIRGAGLAAFEGKSVYVMVRDVWFAEPTFCARLTVENGEISGGTAASVLASGNESSFWAQWFVDSDVAGKSGIGHVDEGEPGFSQTLAGGSVTLLSDAVHAEDPGQTQSDFKYYWHLCP